MGKQSKSFKEVIKAYLDQRAKEDSLFAVSYAKTNKNIDECCDYIIGEVIKGSSMIASNVKGSMVENDDVYGMAVHYYDEDNIKVNKQLGYRVDIRDVNKENSVSKQSLTKEVIPKRNGKKKEVSSAQFLLFDEL